MVETKSTLGYGGFAEEAEKPIDFKYYFFLFKKNFYVLFTFFVIVVTLAAIYVSKIPDNYKATAQIMIEKPASGRALYGQDSPETETEAYSEDYYSTQIEIMRSPGVLKQVADELKMEDYFGVKNGEQAAKTIQGMVGVAQVGKSRLFNISITASEPQLSANLANTLSRVYIRKNFENMLYYSKEILAWLPQKDQENITVEDPFGKVKQMSREELIESLPSIQSDPGLRTLKEKKNFAEAELKTLLRQYREKHPVIIKTRAYLKFIDDSIQSERMRIVDKLKSEAEGKHAVGNARIIEEAKPPDGPLPTNRLRMVLIVSLTELLLSFLLVILIDHFDDSIRSVEDLERKGLILPFLGPIPLLKGKMLEPNQRALTGYYNKNSEISESFRYLRVAINFSASPESLKNLVFTSCLPHEGKSFISNNIAVSFAMDGNKTLLVDADLRRPVVHQAFRIENTNGLTNYLTSNVSFESIVKETFIENLSIVTAGPASPNPGEILGSEKMKTFIQEARGRFDRIIFDCPPLTGIGDPYVVGSLIGQIIMVIAAGRTPADLIKHTQKQLEKTGVKIIGVVLSMVDLNKERYGGYSKYYYHTYTRYYQADEDQQEHRGEEDREKQPKKKMDEDPDEETDEKDE